MKFPFFKTLAITGAIAVAWNCSNDATTAATATPDQQEAYEQGNQTNWVFSANGVDYYISPTDMTVNVNGTLFGIFDATTGSILDASGATVVSGLDLNTLPKVDVSSSSSMVIDPVLDPTSSATVVDPMSSAVVNPMSSAITPAVSSSSNGVQPASSSSQNQQVSSSSKQQSSSSSQQQIVSGNITVTGNLTQTVAQGASTSEIKFSGVSSSEKAQRKSWNAYFLNTSFDNGVFTIKATTVPDYFNAGTVTETFDIDGTTYEFKLTVTAASGNTSVSSSSQAKSSSSQWVASSSSQKSSSSSAKSSSSSATSSSSAASSSSTVVSGSTELVYVSGGASGSGWATRYWDCCKPSCSWEANANGNIAKECTLNGSTISDHSTQSICSGGSSYTCLSQVPIIVNDNLAYAFAAVPSSNGGKCGHCYALTFDGTGKYETKANHKAIAGKVLVVMASNVGSDVSQGQFDIMIPGGGYGMYNGCQAYSWGSAYSSSTQYGGLLSDCESSVGYSGDLLTKRKECLIEKCNSVFSSDAQAKAGCLFLANWMQAAGNPNHTYKEVECPAALKAQY